MKKTRKILAIVLTICLVLSLGVTTVLADAGYSDTEGHWAEDAIDTWTERGIVQGYGDGTFAPNDKITRAEVAQFFVNLLGLTEKADISMFTDVDPDAWYADAIACCVFKGILRGTSTTTMSPNQPITREQFFVMLARAMYLPEDETADKEFSDADEVSDYAQGAVNALINAGFINGMGDGTLAPTLEINRASVMQLLDNAVVAYITEDGEYTVDQPGLVIVKAEDVKIEVASEEVVVIVAEEGADVSLEGSTAEDVSVVALEDGVTVTDAPEGAAVTAAEDAEGVKVNEEEVPAGETVEVEEEKPEPENPPTPIITDPDLDPSAVVDYTFILRTPNKNDYSAVGLEDVTVGDLTFAGCYITVVIDALETHYVVTKNTKAPEIIAVAQEEEAANWNNWGNYVTKTNVGGDLDANITGGKDAIYVDDGVGGTLTLEEAFDYDMYTDAQVAAWKFVIGLTAGDSLIFDGFTITADVDCAITFSTNLMCKDLVNQIYHLGNNLTASTVNSDLVKARIINVLNLLNGANVTLTVA